MAFKKYTHYQKKKGNVIPLIVTVDPFTRVYGRRDGLFKTHLFTAAKP
jgi:hypothetical protein